MYMFFFFFVCLFFYFSLFLLIYVKLYKTNKSGGICLFTLNSSSVYNTRITVHRRKPRYLSPSSKRRTQIPWLATMITVGKPANSDLLLTGGGGGGGVWFYFCDKIAKRHKLASIRSRYICGREQETSSIRPYVNLSFCNDNHIVVNPLLSNFKCPIQGQNKVKLV